MQLLMENARRFGERAEEFRRFADGQAPQALFITCSDSRVIPSLFTGAGPGELFELRTAGGIVPPYDAERCSGETATIEYAVEVLGVEHIVVCGHSHCGAVGALLRGEDLTAVPAMRTLLGNEPAPRAADADAGRDPGDPIVEAVQAHVRTQIERLRGYPCVAARAAHRPLRIHGWCYEVHTGRVTARRAGQDDFGPL
ncbi:carbonic anhydrase [Streptomyces kronopolitis]|uniref:carbonic anhydrase n=1 Tax=Streptomyces kronopolitis TaxID=1612435 RepID=UPI0020BDB1C7|nr:carbonic anhydrase [Streptomyces kronopolitis]MCL6299306.1 carbonic anhydrase [Streptomyces kronopolitis]